MSETRVLMELETAQSFAAWLLGQWCPADAGGHVAGSIRRQCQAIHDVELVLPRPWEGYEGVDVVYERMAEWVWRDGDGDGLFAAERTERQAFVPVRGFSPGFGACQLEFSPGDWIDSPTAECWRELIGVRIDVYRYVPGDEGNFGWIMLMRTGSREFSHKALTHHMLRRGASHGSDGGFLLDGRGRKIATPSEAAAFDAMGLAWVNPRLRRDGRDVTAAAERWQEAKRCD